MPTHDIIVIGASAGGVQAVSELLQCLPPDLPAAIFIVVHLSPHSPGVLPDILSRDSSFTPAPALDGQPIRHGHLYIAPPNHHLLIKPNHIKLVRGPKENGFRPAIDPLFRTAARAYGPRVVGVILSGALDDGTSGLGLIKQHHGVALVQDPREAMIPSMPSSAIRHVEVDSILPVAGIAAKLTALANETIEDSPMTKSDRNQLDIVEIPADLLETKLRQGPPSPFTCPECGGSLWDENVGEFTTFRCHTGHGYTSDGLAAEQDHILENALWVALRILEETAALRRRMADRAAQTHAPALAENYRKQADEAVQQSMVIRRSLSNGVPGARVKASEKPKKRRKAASRAHSQNGNAPKSPKPNKN